MIEKKNNIWILTEERPKKEALEIIFSYFAKDYKCGFFGDSLRILPILDENKCFNFVYEVIGFNCAKVKRVFIKMISGTSSFVDFLIFYQENQPKEDDIPIYAIEETKTGDQESRNTAVFQRCSKFVFIQNYYPTTKKIMLYISNVEGKRISTETWIFGIRLLLTFGVEILGKSLDQRTFMPFKTIEEVIECKNAMRLPPSKKHIPILLTKMEEKIQISGRLLKNNTLSHDPNIGALSMISAVLRQLGWKKNIEITRHGLSQGNVGKKNKFVQIANKLNINLQGLEVPYTIFPKSYWHYEKKGEKLGTIFIHIVVENFTESYSVFENHAGCEKGYFKTSCGEYIPLEKYTDREAYKLGNKDRIVYIPDLVLIDIKENEAITIEGKKYEFQKNGIDELKNYDAFDEIYLKRYYQQYKIIRTVVLYGSQEEKIAEIQVGFLLNENGKLILGIRAPKLFKRAINNLLNFWN